MHPDAGLDVDRVVVLEAAVHRVEGERDLDVPGCVERQPGPGAPLGQGPGDGHRAGTDLLDRAAGPARAAAATGPRAARRRAPARHTPASAVCGSAVLRLGRTGAKRSVKPSRIAFCRLASSITDASPVPRRSGRMATSSADRWVGSRPACSSSQAHRMTPSHPSSGSSGRPTTRPSRTGPSTTAPRGGRGRRRRRRARCEAA